MYLSRNDTVNVARFEETLGVPIAEMVRYWVPIAALPTLIASPTERAEAIVFA